MQTDHVVGEVLDALKRSGVAEKTLVILTSDNGPEITGEVNPGAYDRLQGVRAREHGDPPRCKTGRLGGRTPGAVHRPVAGENPAGSTCDETICHVDLMATLAALLDVKLPADAGVDSVNILPALLGERRKAPLREATVHHSGQGKFAIRRGDWVLIFAPTGDDNRKQGEPQWFQKDRGYVPHTQAGELFNLKTDPTQKNNLYATETNEGERTDDTDGTLCDGGPEYARAEAEERRGYHLGQTGRQVGIEPEPIEQRSDFSVGSYKCSLVRGVSRQFAAPRQGLEP